MLYFLKIELIFFKLINSLNELYEEKQSTATMNAFNEKEIRELMATESRQIEDGIDWAVKEIQKRYERAISSTRVACYHEHVGKNRVVSLRSGEV